MSRPAPATMVRSSTPRWGVPPPRARPRPRRPPERGSRGARADSRLEDRLPERARDELDSERGGAVARVEDGVHLAYLDRAQLPRRREDLHRELRLTVREAAAHRRADPRR